MKIETLLPPDGSGFVTFNRGTNGEFQFGQQTSIDATLAVGTAWNSTHPTRPFSIGHISKRGGGSFDPPHKSHRLGVDIDVRPLRNDGANAPVTIDDKQNYDPLHTRQLIELWWQRAPVQMIFFNDQSVISAGLSRFVEGHDNHFHVRLRIKDATIKIGDRGSDVAEVQGILHLPADGVFGPATQHAVELFQEQEGLVADGVVGPKTWKALRAV